MSILDKAQAMLATSSGCVATKSGVHPFDADRLGQRSIREAFADITLLEDGCEEILFIARRHDEVTPRILPVDLLLGTLSALLIVVGKTGTAKMYPPNFLRRKASSIQMGTI